MHHLCLVIFPVIMGCEAIKYILRPILPKIGNGVQFRGRGLFFRGEPHVGEMIRLSGRAYSPKIQAHVMLH